MDNPQKGRIFISYRRADSAGYAGRIYDRLTVHFGVDAVFMDVSTIEAGVDFVKVLQDEVQSCDVLLVLIGRSWLDIEDETGQRRLYNSEDFVKIEVSAALSRDIRVIPVLVDGVKMPSSTELPDNLKALVRRNALQVNHHSFNADIERLISQLELALDAAGKTWQKSKKEVQGEIAKRVAVPAEKKNSSPKDKRVRKTAWLPYGIGGVVLVVIACLIFGGALYYRTLFAPDERTTTEPPTMTETPVLETMKIPANQPIELSTELPTKTADLELSDQYIGEPTSTSHPNVTETPTLERTEPIIRQPFNKTASDLSSPSTIVRPGDPVPGPNCPQWIAFHTFRLGNLEIFRLDGVEDGSGTNLINLSNSNAMDSRPSRSPDDQWVVFQSDRDGNIELYVGDTEGKSQSRLTNTDADNINAMFGPDNQSVIFQSNRNGNWDIYIIDAETGTERQLTTSAYDDVNPYWSPDKDWIVFQSNQLGTWNIYLLNISTQEEYTVMDVPYDVVFPSWSPNGKQVAFLANQDGNWDLYISDLQGSNVKRITSQGNAGNVSWSPEGDRLAYQFGIDENTEIFTYDLLTDQQYQLTNFAGPDSAPTWDCGGANISFTSLSSGNLDIYGVPWQGGEIGYITNNPATDKWPEWSPAKEFASRGY